MATYHVHRMPEPANPPPNVVGVHFSMTFPELPEAITGYIDFINWINDNPEIIGEVICCLHHLQKPQHPA